MSAFFERTGDRAFRPTAATGGGWNPADMHISPIAGLLVHSLNRYTAEHGAPRLRLARISFDILGRLPFGEYRVDVRVIRPGRTIELVEASATVDDRPVVIARAWRLVHSSTAEIAAAPVRPMPRPDEVPPWPISRRWPGTFAATLDVRAEDDPEGRGTRAWIRSSHDILLGEPDPVAGFIALTDVANAIAPRHTPPGWFYPNVELTVHLQRLPRPGWVGVDSWVSFGDGGLGTTTSLLHDEDGPVGVASQALTVRPGEAPTPPTRSAPPG